VYWQCLFHRPAEF